MKCSLNILKDVKSTLEEGAKEASAQGTDMTHEGASYALLKELFLARAKAVRKPEQLLAAINERTEALKTRFHQALRMELSEELEIEIDGKASPFYLIGSQVLLAKNESEHQQIKLQLAPVGDVSNLQTFVFDSRTGESVEYPGASMGTLVGGDVILPRALDGAARAEIKANWKEVKFDDKGDPDLRQYLGKMEEVNKELGSSASVTEDKLTDYHKVESGTIGNIQKMKELLGKLHVLGGSRAGEGMMSYYSSLFDRMHPSFFNKMDVYYKTNADEARGVVIPAKGQMRLNVTDGSDVLQRTEAEVYAHEVVHAMTEYALESVVSGTGTIKTELGRLMEATLKKVKWQDFLHRDESEASEREIERAKKELEYVFASKHSLDEFVAYALTNPVMMKVTQGMSLSEARTLKGDGTIFGAILAAFSKLMDKVLGAVKIRNKDDTVFDRVNELAFALARVNDRNAGKLSNMNAIGQMMEVLADSESLVARKIHAVTKKIGRVTPLKDLPDDASLFQRAKFSVALIAKGLVDPVYRSALGLVASAYGIKPGGTVREFLGSLFERDDVFRASERLKLLSDHLQAARNGSIDSISKTIKKAAKVPLTEEEESALTSILLNTNLAALRYRGAGRKRYTDKKMIEILTNSEERTTQIGRLKHEIKELLGEDATDRANWSIAQAMDLGFFMATGKGNEATNTNSRNIVKGYGLSTVYEWNDRLERLVGELATLTALNYTNPADNITTAKLLKDEKKVINVVTDMYEQYVKLSKSTVFRGKEGHFLEGHTKEKFDDTIDIKIAPLEDRAILEAEGFTFRHEVKDATGVKSKVKMAVYTTDAWGKAERQKGAVSLGRDHTRGTKLSSLKMREDPTTGRAMFQRDFAQSINVTAEIHRAMMDGTYDVANTPNGLVPVYNLNGDIVDYRYTMDKDTKKKLLKQDLKISEVLARSVAGIESQVREESLNDEVLNVIREDMKNNWRDGTVGENGLSEYLLIGPEESESINEEGAKLYMEIPPSYRRFIHNRKDKTMAVRRDLVPLLMGSTHMRTTDIVGLNLLPGALKSIVNAIEGMWMEVVKLSKGAILIKMPAILAINMVTNVLLQISQGHLDIRELFRDYKESFKEVHEYLKVKKQITDLEYEIESNVASLARARNTGQLRKVIEKKNLELKMLKRARDRNPAHELFEAGYYQSYIEDAEKSAISDTNRVTKSINKRLDRAPAAVRATVDTLYLTQNTSWYKWSQEVLQRSDMVSRMVSNKNGIRLENRMADGDKRLPEWWLEDKGKNYKPTKVLKGKEREEFLDKARQIRMNHILDTFINYSLPNGRFEEYANRMGFLMFTKYIKRIQKVVTDTTMNNPIKSSLLVVAALAGLPVETIVTQSLGARAMGYDGEFSLGNIVGGYTPLYHMQNVLHPPLLKEEMLGAFY